MNVEHPGAESPGRRGEARPDMGDGHLRRPSSRGFTLIEVIVVLLLLGLAATLAAPMFITPEESDSGLATVVRGARQLAERRGENLYLDMGLDGRWAVTGAASPTEGALADGELADYDGPAFRLVLSPIGSCAPDVRSSSSLLQLDPLTCELGEP